MINITTVERKASKYYAAVEVDTKNCFVRVWLQVGKFWKCNGQRYLEIQFEPYHSKKIVISLYHKLIEEMEHGLQPMPD